MKSSERKDNAKGDFCELLKKKLLTFWFISFFIRFAVEIGNAVIL